VDGLEKHLNHLKLIVITVVQNNAPAKQEVEKAKWKEVNS
jgi:hypothetical protein